MSELKYYAKKYGTIEGAIEYARVELPTAGAGDFVIFWLPQFPLTETLYWLAKSDEDILVSFSKALKSDIAYPYYRIGADLQPVFCPALSRTERGAELRLKVQLAEGRKEIFYLYYKYTKTSIVVDGMPADLQWIQAIDIILNNEYPAQSPTQVLSSV